MRELDGRTDCTRWRRTHHSRAGTNFNTGRHRAPERNSSTGGWNGNSGCRNCNARRRYRYAWSRVCDSRTRYCYAGRWHSYAAGRNANYPDSTGAHAGYDDNSWSDERNVDHDWGYAQWREWIDRWNALHNDAGFDGGIQPVNHSRQHSALSSRNGLNRWWSVDRNALHHDGIAQRNHHDTAVIFTKSYS